MKLKALKVHGFKSFADTTEIDFHEGITAVVGPNGCGKSNISDAIRWVLGEQRPTAIRGARMEEAIFQGTVNRRPVNRGTVSLWAYLQQVAVDEGVNRIAFQKIRNLTLLHRPMPRYVRGSFHPLIRPTLPPSRPTFHRYREGWHQGRATVPEIWL